MFGGAPLPPPPPRRGGGGGDFGDADDGLGDDSALFDAMQADAPALGGDAETPPSEIIPIVHPRDAQIEVELGPEGADDHVCYLCDVVDLSDPTRVDPKISNLVAFIADKRRKAYSDPVKFARCVKARFNAEIREPQNALARARLNRRKNAAPKPPLPIRVPPHQRRRMTHDPESSDIDADDALDDVMVVAAEPPQPQPPPLTADGDGGDADEAEPVKDWTLRSIYDHITRHDKSPEAQNDHVADMMYNMLSVLHQNGVYVAKTEVAKNPKPEDVRVETKAAAMIIAAARTLFTINKARGDTRGLVANGSGGGGGGVDSNHSATRGALTTAAATGQKKGAVATSTISAVAAASTSKGKTRSGTRPTWY